MSDMTTTTQVIALGAEVYLDSDLAKKIELLPEAIREDFKNHAYKATFFKRATEQATPLDFLKERKGSWNKDLNDYNILEYFPEDYTLTELDRLFPGWWEEGMADEWMPGIRTYKVTGYLCVEYPTLKGTGIVKRWAVAGAEVFRKIDPVTQKQTDEPSQPEDRLKAARTEWIKVAGKHYGIGLEIYHQKITPALRAMFEDRIRSWGVYAQVAKEIAATLETGHGFRNYLKELPTVTQTKRIIAALEKIPSDMTSKHGNVHDLTWKQFTRLLMDTKANRQQAEQFIAKVEALAENIHNKEQGETNA